jgi:ankyrin repeat protein
VRKLWLFKKRESYEELVPINVATVNNLDAGESQSIAQGGVQKMAGYWDDVLLEAAMDGELIIVQTALEKGANPNAKDNIGRTPLHYAALQGHVEIVKLLLERGAILWIADNGGQIPLDYANDSTVRSLLESALRK